MDPVILRSNEWSCDSVTYALTFWERWRGLRGQPPGTALLVGTRSVHGVGMRYPFRAIGLTSQFRVVGTKLVRPWHFASFPGCRYVLELPVETEPPPQGTTLELRSV